MAKTSFALPDVVRNICDQIDRAIVVAAAGSDDSVKYGVKLFTDIQTHCRVRLAELTTKNDPLDRRICEAVATAFGISPAEIIGKSHQAPASTARQIRALMLHEITLSERRCSEITGLHRTVIRYQVIHARKLISSSAAVRARYQESRQIFERSNQTH